MMNAQMFHTLDPQWLKPENLEAIASILVKCPSAEILHLLRSSIPSAVLREASKGLATSDRTAKARILSWLEAEIPDEAPVCIQGWDFSVFKQLQEVSDDRDREPILPASLPPFPEVGDRIYRRACKKYRGQVCRVTSISYTGAFAESETGRMWHISYYAWQTQRFIPLQN